MPLIVPGNRRFVIIPKHSNLPLAPLHHQRHPGNVIQQQEPYTNNPAQQFELQQNGLGEYHVHLPYDGLYWAIAGVSPNAGANLIQWHMQDRDGQVSTNQRFRFMHAGGGYYYLRPVHAQGRVLEVPGATHGQDTIKQGDLVVPNAALDNRNHQLFRVVPVSTEYPSNAAPAFRQYSDLLRDVVMGILGATPKIGGIVKGAAGVLWPDGHDQDFWNQMTAYVEQRLQSVLLQERITTLRGMLDAARKLVDEIEQTRNLTDKREKLTAAIVAATFSDPKFERVEEGVKVLPLLLAWGLLRISLRAEVARNYEALHPNEKDPEQMRVGKEDALRFLQTEIDNFTNTVARSRAEALKWRLSQISRGERQWNDDKFMGEGRVETTVRRHDWVEDRYAGWRVDRHASSDRDSTLDRSGKAAMEEVLEERIAQVTAQFGAELDVLLAPSRVWPYLNPSKTTAPQNTPHRLAVGPFGRERAGTAFSMDGQKVTRIVLWTHAGNRPHGFLSGLQLGFSDGRLVSYGATQQGTSQELIMRVDGDEYITNIRGYQWDIVEQLTIETSHGRTISAGNVQHASYFEAGLDDGLDARLVGISGTHKNDFFTTLTFLWEYKLKE